MNTQAATSMNNGTGNGLLAMNASDELAKQACGQIVYWSLSGNVSIEALQRGLDNAGSLALLPEEPSPKVAIHRAMDAVAVAHKADTQSRRRGEWVIVGGATEEIDGDGKSLVYPILAEAHVEGQDAIVNSSDSAYYHEIHQAYREAQHSLAPSDIGAWLCTKVVGLGGIALRASGGFYFIPKDAISKWEKVARALKEVSAHRLQSIPAMRTEDAVDAILTALTRDTEDACQAISDSIREGKLGARALETKETDTKALLDRIGKYETLLGVKLEALREGMEATKVAIVTAKLAQAAVDADAE